MSAPFRISISLNNFFSDQRSLSYILIDNRFQTIADLEEHIKTTFKLDGDCDICLISNNHLLPSTEGINILVRDDSVHVTPINRNLISKNKHKIHNLDGNSTKSKRRKVSKRDEIQASDEVSSDDHKQNEQETIIVSRKKKKDKTTQSESVSETTLEIDSNLLPSVQKVEAEEEIMDDKSMTPETKLFDKSSIHILNIENVSNMSLDNIEHSPTYECEKIEIETLPNESNQNNLYVFNGLNYSDNNMKITSSDTETVQLKDNQGSENIVVNIYNEEWSKNVTVPAKSSRRRHRKPAQFTIGNFIDYAQKLANKEEITPNTKRRQRIRKRKSGLNRENNNVSLIPEIIIEKPVAPIKTIAKPSIHIRFNEDDATNENNYNMKIDEANDNNEILKSILKKGENTTPKIIPLRRNDDPPTPILKTPNSNSEKQNISNGDLSIEKTYEFKDTPVLKRKNSNEQILVNSNQNLNLEENQSIHELTNHIQIATKNIQKTFTFLHLIENMDKIKYTPLISEVPPKIDDILAFKMYQMTENYEPSISNWIVGKVLKWYPENKSLDLLILAGEVQFNLPDGRFNLEDPSLCEEGRKKDITNIIHLHIKSLIEPRLLLIENEN